MMAPMHVEASRRASAHAPRRILLVEDDAAIRSSLAGVFLDEGFEVLSAANGQEALEVLRTGPPADIIILDLMLPVMDGWEFRAQQRADPAFAAIPVVAISADTSAKAAAIHADAYMRKPFRAQEVLRTVERILLERENTQMRARLEHAQRLAALGTLAAGVGHEINNPLFCVITNLSLVEKALPQMRSGVGLLRRAPLDADAATACEALEKGVSQMGDLLRDARAGADRISGIVHNLRQLAKPPDNLTEPLRVRAFVEGALKLAAGQIRPRGRLVEEYEDDVCVEGDETRLTQVVLNLLVNAAQALPEGRPDENFVRVRVGRDGARALVEVADSGSGMPPGVRARLFEPYFTTKGRSGGTGLGLSICRGIVTAHSGTIEVQSEVGAGSVFRVVLPAAPDTGRREVKAPPREAAAEGPRLRILAVDDDPIVLATIGRLLEGVHEVVTEMDAKRALERVIGGEAYDAILCDLIMPEMDGVEFHRVLAARAGGIAERVVFVTGGAISDRARALMASGQHPVLEKPFTLDELRAALDAVLARRPAAS
jgi:signal transduction histidine kinase